MWYRVKGRKTSHFAIGNFDWFTSLKMLHQVTARMTLFWWNDKVCSAIINPNKLKSTSLTLSDVEIKKVIFFFNYKSISCELKHSYWTKKERVQMLPEILRQIPHH